jgi:hypothetical protein
VGVSVIDWTTTGAPPPMATPPTLMPTSEPIPASVAAASDLVAVSN